MHTITNNYRDAHILNLGSGGERGPYSCNSNCASQAIRCRRNDVCAPPDGRWVDFNAYACQGKPEAMDEIVFSTTTQIMETFGKLFRRPQVHDMPVDEAGLKAG